MKYLCIAEPTGRCIYINPEHVISIFRGSDGVVNVKVSDGKVYLAQDSIQSILTHLEEACSSQD